MMCLLLCNILYIFVSCVFSQGWGCAYRTLQSMCSWIEKNRTTMDVDANQLGPNDIPSIEEIQQTLVNINDKPPAFLNSTDWLGALEVCIFEWDRFNDHQNRQLLTNFFFFILSISLDFLCDWHVVWYIMSHSAYPKLPWHPKVFQYHKILFWKFWRPNHDGWRFGCIIEMHCGHSHSW